jgi:hypothetical protein
MVASAILDDENPPLTLVQYLVMNALFYGACLVVLFFVRMGLQETRGLWYFFGLIMISFSAVSLYDFAYDRLSRKSGSAA